MIKFLMIWVFWTALCVLMYVFFFPGNTGAVAGSFGVKVAGQALLITGAIIGFIPACLTKVVLG